MNGGLVGGERHGLETPHLAGRIPDVGGELHPVVRSQPHREPCALHEPVDGPREHPRHGTDAHLRSEGGTELEHCLGDLGRLAHRRVEAHVAARNRRVRGDDLQHAQIECIERIASGPRDDDRADGVLVAQHRGHHCGLAGNQPRPAVHHGAGGRGVGDRGPFVGVRFAALDRRQGNLFTGLGTQIEARGMEPVLADQLGDDRVSDLALRAGVRQTGRERSQEAHLGQQPVAGAGRDDVRRRLERARARRRAGADRSAARRLRRAGTPAASVPPPPDERSSGRPSGAVRSEGHTAHRASGSPRGRHPRRPRPAGPRRGGATAPPREPNGR